MIRRIRQSGKKIRVSIGDDEWKRTFSYLLSIPQIKCLSYCSSHNPFNIGGNIRSSTFESLYGEKLIIFDWNEHEYCLTKMGIIVLEMLEDFVDFKTFKI